MTDTDFKDTYQMIPSAAYDILVAQDKVYKLSYSDKFGYKKVRYMLGDLLLVLPPDRAKRVVKSIENLREKRMRDLLKVLKKLNIEYA